MQHCVELHLGFIWAKIKIFPAQKLRGRPTPTLPEVLLHLERSLQGTLGFQVLLWLYTIRVRATLPLLFS